MAAPEPIRALAASRGLEPAHPPACLAEAAAWERAPGIDDPRLTDLTHLPFVTIDEEQSRDLDQALHIARDGDGYVVWYAIADAAFYAPPGSALLAEAVRRASTFYLPGHIVPMLPPSLSEGIVSLNPGVDRRALVFRVQLAADGTVVDAAVVRGRVRSRLKTWYDAVQAAYDGGPFPGDAEVRPTLELLREVGERRIDVALGRDVVQYRRAELAIRLHGETGAVVALADPRNDCERYNEQISLLCNMEGARLLHERSGDHVQPVFRTHDPPEPSRLEDLAALLDALVAAHRLDPAVWRWDRSVSLQRFLQHLPRGGPEGRIAEAVHRQAMVAGGSASFRSTAGVHLGVGADLYARFTAPMREVVGVFTHKETWELLGLQAPRADAADEALREQIIEAAARARQTQRELDREVNRLAIDTLFREDVAQGRTRTGTVLGLSRNKVYVRLDDPPVDVKAYHRHLEAEVGEALVTSADGAVVQTKGAGDRVLAVGDGVEVRALGHDRERDRWRLGVRPAAVG